MHRNLSRQLNETIESGDKSPTIDIKAEPKGAMYDVISGRSTYTIVVVDPGQQEIAMKTNNPKIPDTDIWYLMGAGWGGSMMKIGCIVVGAQMRARRLSGGIMETSPVTRFAKINDPNKAQSIIDEAELRRPQVMSETEEEEYRSKFAQAVEQLIAKEFAENQEWVRWMVDRFGNMAAKGVVLGVLTQAKAHGKFEQAKQLLERDWEKYWVYQPPSIAGHPEAMPLNAHRWAALYSELGIPLPGQ